MPECCAWRRKSFVRILDEHTLTNGSILGELARREDRDFDANTYDEERAARYARREGFY